MAKIKRYFDKYEEDRVPGGVVHGVVQRGVSGGAGQAADAVWWEGAMRSSLCGYHCC